MHDINKISKVDNVPIKKLIVYSPEQCPFRVLIIDRYGDDDEYCSYLKSLHKVLNSSVTIPWSGRKISIEKEDDGVCVCTEERWIEGCPLLSNSFIVEKN